MLLTMRVPETSDSVLKQPSVIVRIGEGAGCPLSLSAPRKKMRGAERRQALVRNAAPMVRLAVGPVSGSPETPAGSPTGAPLGALLRRSSLRRRAALFGTGGPLWVRGH